MQFITHSPVATQMHLPHQAMFSVPQAAHVQIVCETGSLWITLDNDARDIILEAGQSFTSQQASRATVYALQATSLTVTQVQEHKRASEVFSGEISEEKWQYSPVDIAQAAIKYVATGVKTYLANNWFRSPKALNSSALPDGSRKNMVACSPS